MSFVISFSLLIFFAFILSFFILLFFTFFHLTFICWLFLLGLLIVCTLIHPTPSIVPSDNLGQSCWPCGHRFFASSQIILRALWLHSRRICSIDSVLLHFWHLAWCLKFGMPVHFSPTI